MGGNGQLAAGLTEDLRNVDARIRETRKKLTVAVRAARTCLTGLSGCGPGHRRRGHRRRPPRAPLPRPGSFRRLRRHRAHRGVLGRPQGVPAVPARQPPAQSRHPHDRGHPDPLPAQPGPRLLRAAPTTTRSWPRARLAKRRCAASSGRSAARSSPASRQMPGAPQPPRRRAREGNRGTTPDPGRPARTPGTGSSGKPLPGPPPTLWPPLLPFPRRCPPARASGQVKDRAEPGRAAAPQGILDAAGREPIMPRAGKEARPGARQLPTAGPLLHRISAAPLTLKQRGIR